MTMLSGFNALEDAVKSPSRYSSPEFPAGAGGSSSSFALNVCECIISCI